METKQRRKQDEEDSEKQGTEAERLSREIEREARRFPRGLDLEEEA